MNTSRIDLPEGDLLNVIEDLSPLVWRRYRSRVQRVLVDNRFIDIDRSDVPPFVAFRFASDDNEVIDRLSYVVDSYVGKLKWAMEGRQRRSLPGINWIICTSRMSEVLSMALDQEMSPGDYLAKTEPALGPVAYEDMVDLTRHVRKAFCER